MREWSPMLGSRLHGSAQSDPKTVDGQSAPYVYFGLIGLSSLIDLVPYGTREFGFFERVQEPPNSNAIFRAFGDPRFANALVRYSQDVTFQLAISTDYSAGECRELALRIVNALRVRTRADMLVPAHISISWSDVHRAIPGSCSGVILEDIPAALTLEKDRNIELEDFEWLWSTGEVFADLLTNARFNLAVESLCYCHLLRDPRMMAAGLWAGIEALIDVSQELRYRISMIAASILEARGERRRALFKRIQTLYDMRSKAVHGAEVPQDKLIDHVIEVRILLAQLIMKLISVGRVYSQDDFDRLMLM